MEVAVAIDIAARKYKFVFCLKFQGVTLALTGETQAVSTSSPQ
jgi:hypothetical protein